MREQGEQEREMDSNPMNGAANVAYAKADIITRRNASTPASTVTCAAATEVQNVVEEEEKIGITAMAKMTDTETKTKDSDDQKARTKPTEKQLTDKEPRENHSESKQTETMEEKAPPTRVPMIPITGAIASHRTMTEEIPTPGEATE